MGGGFNAAGAQLSGGDAHGDFDLHGNLAWDTSALNNYGVLVVMIVPEPGVMPLMMLGLFGILHRRRRSANAPLNLTCYSVDDLSS